MPVEQSVEAQSLKGKRILIADDLEGNQVLGALFLKIAGAEVEVVSDGAEAVKRALSGQHDAILMDVHMPILNGLTATERLRKEGFEKPIIVVTSDRREGLREKALGVGADSFLWRPLTLAAVTKIFQEQFCEAAG